MWLASSPNRSTADSPIQELPRACVCASLSYIPFPFAPRQAGIELTVPEHTMHHASLRKNFGKRFNVCDRLFGTFVAGA